MGVKLSDIAATLARVQDEIDLDGTGDKLDSFLKQVSDLATAKSLSEAGQCSDLLSQFFGIAHGRISERPVF